MGEGGNEDEVAVLITHAPLWLEGLGHGCLGEDLVAGQTADTSGTTADGAGLRRREAAPVAADRACVAAVVRLGEFAGRGKVEACEGALRAEEMTVKMLATLMLRVMVVRGYGLTGWAAWGALRRR